MTVNSLQSTSKGTCYSLGTADIFQKIIKRTQELEIANNQLTELNATKDKFFNIVKKLTRNVKMLW